MWCMDCLTPWRPSSSLTNTTRLLDPSFTGLVNSMDRSAWYLLKYSGYSKGKAVSLSTSLPSMSLTTRLSYCTWSVDLTISSNTLALCYEASGLLNMYYMELYMRLQDENFCFMWRPPWLSKLSMCSPDCTTTMGIMALLWALNDSPTVSPALSPTHLHHDQFPVAGGDEELLSDMFSFWSVGELVLSDISTGDSLDKSVKLLDLNIILACMVEQYKAWRSPPRLLNSVNMISTTAPMMYQEKTMNSSFILSSMARLSSSMTRMREWLPRKPHYISTSRQEDQSSWILKSSSTLSTAYLHQDQLMDKALQFSSSSELSITSEIPRDYLEETQRRNLNGFIGWTLMMVVVVSLSSSLTSMGVMGKLDNMAWKPPWISFLIKFSGEIMCQWLISSDARFPRFNLASQPGTWLPSPPSSRTSPAWTWTGTWRQLCRWTCVKI